MRRTVTIRTEQCKLCHAEMCDAHLAQELGIAAKCSNPRLRRFCVVCAGKKVDADYTVIDEDKK